ncbi:Uncharacterised protein [Vibrio cholerae]|nr:Uncharacterised protein [Vibrio cholerae]
MNAVSGIIDILWGIRINDVDEVPVCDQCLTLFIYSNTAVELTMNRVSTE